MLRTTVKSVEQFDFLTLGEQAVRRKASGVK